ncbi:MAG: DUF3857 and transglutaminase domain-containing protein [Pseudomonadota bacterium]
MLQILMLLATVRTLAPAEAPLAVVPPEPPEDLRALIDGAGSAKDQDGAGLVLVFDRTRVEVEASGLAHYYRHRLFKVLDEKGATELATLRFDYDPSSNLVEVKRARVHRGPADDGTLPKPEDLGEDRLTDLPQPQHMIYWGPRMKLLSVPRLHPGDALEVETYTKGFIIAYLDGATGASASGSTTEGDDSKYIPPMRGHFYDVVLFGDAAVPTLERRYQVTLPRDRPLQFEVFNGEVASRMAFDKQRTTYTFWKKKLPAHTPEAKAADASDYLPKVVMATVPSWEAKSRWFFEVNESQFEANDAIRQKVAEITRGARSEEDKIDAILHWTAQEIRYSGISMGQGEGYTLHSGAMTFNDRAGVCKDIAGMSITMLRAAGFTSYPAMTMAGARVEQVPADQFNHCVVAVQRPEGFRMIDPTWAPFSSELWSSAEREQHYVIGTPQGLTLMQTPYLPPEHNHLTITARSRLDLKGDLVSEVTIGATGYVEDRMRRLLAYRSVLELHAAVSESLVRVSPLAELEDLRFSDHRDLKTPLVVTLRYRVPRYAHVGDRVLGSGLPLSRHILANGSLADWLFATTTPSRQAAIWLRSPQQLSFHETLELPAGFVLRGVPLDHRTTSDLGNVRATLVQERDELRFDEEIRILQRNIAPKDYTALKTVADAVRSVGETRIYLERPSREETASTPRSRRTRKGGGR